MSFRIDKEQLDLEEEPFAPFFKGMIFYLNGFFLILVKPIHTNFLCQQTTFIFYYWRWPATLSSKVLFSRGETI